MFFKRKSKFISFLFLTILFVLICINIPFAFIDLLDEDAIITRQELEEVIKKNNLFYSTSFSSFANSSNDETLNDYIVEYKLFNLFTIKNLKIKVLEDDKFFVGGECIGFSLKSQGLIIVGGNYILTKSGRINPLLNSDLKMGDLITHINNNEISSIDDIYYELEKYNGEPLKVKVKRNNQNLILDLIPALDIQSNSYKLGLWVKDEAMGVGTLTFINGTKGRFGALGHAITSSLTSNDIEVKNGNIYDCSVVGVKVGKNGIAGELMGVFSLSQEPIGDVDKNCENGVYGNIANIDDYISTKDEVKVGGRLSVNPGKAKILCCICGDKIEEFEIEIIKTNYQKGPNEKSMVIKISDKDLIKKTGGIVQGMSGSPIIQNGKLIGAVTHVFLNDATKGFGLYIDWMLNE